MEHDNTTSNKIQLTILPQLQRLFALMSLSTRAVISPRMLLQVLDSMYRSCEQQDITEFGRYFILWDMLMDTHVYRYLLDALSSELQSTSLRSPLQRIFMGKTRTTVQCSTCHYKTAKEVQLLTLCS